MGENASTKPGLGLELDLKRVAMARTRGGGGGEDGVDGGSLAEVRVWRE